MCYHRVNIAGGACSASPTLIFQLDDHFLYDSTSLATCRVCLLPRVLYRTICRHQKLPAPPSLSHAAFTWPIGYSNRVLVSAWLGPAHGRAHGVYKPSPRPSSLFPLHFITNTSTTSQPQVPRLSELLTRRSCIILRHQFVFCILPSSTKPHTNTMSHDINILHSSNMSSSARHINIIPSLHHPSMS